jgi:hypothetical protein
MASKIANTLFHSGPDDTLLTVDAYEIINNAPKNNIIETFNEVASDVITELRNNPNALNDIKSTLTSSAIKSLSKTEVMGRLGEQLGVIKPHLKKLSGEVSDILVNKFNANPDLVNGLTDVLVNINGTPFQYTGVVADEIKVLLELAGELETIDLTLESLLTSSLVTDMLSRGMHTLALNTVDALVIDEVSKRVLLDTLTVFLDNGVIDIIDRVLDKVDSNTLLGQRPRLVSEVLRGYRLPGSLSVTDYPVEENRLISTLNRIDPRWSQLKRNQEYVSDLTPFIEASEDALTLFSHGTQYRTEALIAESYTTVTQKRLVNEFYPRAAIR